MVFLRREFDEGGRQISLSNLSAAVPGGTISSHALQLDANGNWTADYVRLRVEAEKK